MVIVFATVVFTGSIVKGTRDRMGRLFAKSIKTDQDSNSNGSAISGEPHDTSKDSPYDRTPIPHALVNQPRKCKTTRTRCFQSYSSDDFFTSAEDTLAVKDHRDQEDASEERKDSKGGRHKTTTSATVEADHGKDETIHIRDKVPRSGTPEHKDTFETRVSDEGKPTTLSFQGYTSQRSQLRHRRKRLKTLKVELEEAGMLTNEDGETQIKAEHEPQLEESSLQRSCDGTNTEMRCKNVYRDQTSELHTVHSEIIAGENGTLGNSQSSRDASSMVTGKLEEQSPPSEEHSKGYSKEDGNDKIVNAFEGENDGASKDASTDSHTADGDEALLPQEPFYSYDNRRPNVIHLHASTERIDSLPVDAGDAIQDQIKIENQQRQEGTISETGDFGKPTERDPEEAAAVNVNSARTTRMKHRSQKGIEDKLFLHRNNHPENDATLKESVIESKSRPSKEESEDDTQPSEVLRNQTARKTTIRYANDASSTVQTGSNLSRNPRTMNKLLAPRSSTVDLTDALDRVVARFNESDAESDTLQDSGLLSGEPDRRSDEERFRALVYYY
eukprot:XP_011677771.1 PREDICTED: uncharacterized protein LOC105444776 [Strongylocentrotus purpuratus]